MSLSNSLWESGAPGRVKVKGNIGHRRAGRGLRVRVEGIISLLMPKLWKDLLQGKHIFNVKLEIRIVCSQFSLDTIDEGT